MSRCFRQPWRPEEATSPWIGQPQAELLRVWGIPSQTQDREGRRVVSYHQRVVDTIYAPAQGCPAGQSP